MPDTETHNEAHRKPVRFGILCSGINLETWQARCLDDLRSADGVELVQVILSLDSRHSSGLNPSLLFRLHLTRLSLTSARRPVELLGAAPNVQRFSCSLDASSREDLDKIRELDLDFILNFSSGQVNREILSIPRYGVWEFCPAAGIIGRGIAGFWELYRDDPVIAASLVQTADSDSGSIVLRQGCLRTDERSHARTTDQLLYEMAKWPRRVCTDLLREDADYFAGPIHRATPSGAPMPSNLQMLAFGARIVRRRLQFAWARLFQHPQWNIGVIAAPIHALIGSGSTAKVQWYPLSGRNGFLADPFGIPRKGGATILCEYYDYRLGKGKICSIEFDEHTFATSRRTAIDLPFHLSYPYLVESRGEIYCIPENLRSREVTVFKAERFPDRWEKAGVLLRNVAAVDTTVFQYDGRWWLMCTDADAGADLNLFVWHAPDLLGPWTPHARNPVKTDVRSARSGGTPFFHAGQLYRPAQDCSKRYGWRVALNRITRLTPTEFAEELVGIIDPQEQGPFPAGRHTLSAAGDLTLIDGHHFVFVGRAFLNFLKIWFRDIARSVLPKRWARDRS